MATKVFLEYQGFSLISDERDVMVSTDHRREVIKWCKQNKIQAELVTIGLQEHKDIKSMFGVNLWRIKDDEQRTLFVLRWS